MSTNQRPCHVNNSEKRHQEWMGRPTPTATFHAGLLSSQAKKALKFRIAAKKMLEALTILFLLSWHHCQRQQINSWLSCIKQESCSDNFSHNFKSIQLESQIHHRWSRLLQHYGLQLSAAVSCLHFKRRTVLPRRDRQKHEPVVRICPWRGRSPLLLPKKPSFAPLGIKTVLTLRLVKWFTMTLMTATMTMKPNHRFRRLLLSPTTAWKNQRPSRKNQVCDEAPVLAWQRVEPCRRFASDSKTRRTYCSRANTLCTLSYHYLPSALLCFIFLSYYDNPTTNVLRFHFYATTNDSVQFTLAATIYLLFFFSAIAHSFIHPSIHSFMHIHRLLLPSFTHSHKRQTAANHQKTKIMSHY